MYIVTLELNFYEKDVFVSRHRTLKAAKRKAETRRKQCERQPAMKYHIYKRVC